MQLVMLLAIGKVVSKKSPVPHLLEGIGKGLGSKHLFKRFKFHKGNENI